MKARIYLTVVLVFSLYANINAQRNCGSMDYLEQQLQDYPQMYDRMQDIEKLTQQFVDTPEKTVNGIITIPVVVHVVYNTTSENISAAQINSQMAVLTDDFRRLNTDANGTWPQADDTEIEFCLASIDPQGNSTNGITRTSTSVTSFSTNDNVKFNSTGGKDAWPTQDYLNIWVCDLGGGILGYAQFPGGPANTDGVVTDYQYFGTTGSATAPFDLGRTTTHEVGHWLNLRHIWGDGPCSADDLVNDTPDSDNPNYGCPLSHTSCGSTDMVANYMDYTDDSCMNLYTSGQKTRMRALFEPNGFRVNLLNSAACGTPPPPSCNDGIQNGDETGIDCGGTSCPPCASCAGTELTLTIVLDNYPEETSWNIVDSNNNTVASGGTYGNLPAGSTVTEILCLPDDCYDFSIFDSYGDGICCSYGNGSYQLVNNNNSTTMASGGSFGSIETTNFCLNTGPPPTCNDGIQNGDETGVDCGGTNCPPCTTCTETELTLTIILDDYPEETSWDIVDSNNNTVASGGTYDNLPAGSTVTETLCLPDDCYDFSIFDSYGDGICCSYGNGSYQLINNNNSTILASGGSFGSIETTNFCLGGGNPPGCVSQLINRSEFDNGWGIWIDGGSDCRRSANDSNFAYSSPRPVRLRDNTNSSVMTTQDLDLSGFEEVTIDFTYITASMENGKDFWLQYSSDGGGSWQTLITYVKGIDFNNNSREFESVVITEDFNANTRFRFRCDAANNGDRVYIDDVEINGCFAGTARQIDESVLVSQDSSKIDALDSYIHILKIYPNPAQWECTIELKSELKNEIRLNLYNSVGLLVHSRSEKIVTGISRLSLDTAHLEPGIYLVEIIQEEVRQLRRLFITK